MFRVPVWVFVCLCSSAFATPISGRFVLSAAENFVEISESDSRFTWHFGPAVFNACGDELCSVDPSDLFTGALTLPSGAFALTDDEGRFLANRAGDTLSGSLTWRVEQTSRDNRGLRKFASGSMEINGVLTTVDGGGRNLLSQTLAGSGTFEAQVRRRHGDFVFAEAEGEFTGTLTPDQEATAMPEPGAAGLVVLGLGAIVLVRRFGPRRA